MRVSVLLIGILAAGCAPESAVESGTGFADSAGVAIATSNTSAGVADRWVVSEQPARTIGLADGDPDQILYRVYSARLLEDNRILLSNSGTHKLRIYDLEGRLERTFGGLGEGPGEFGEFSSMRVVAEWADTLAVSDMANGRLNVYTTDGTFVRTVVPSEVTGYGRPYPVGRFADGRWLASAPVGSRALEGAPGDLIRRDQGYLVFDASMELAEVIATAQWRPRVVNELGGGAIHYPYVPLTPSPVEAVSGDMVALGSGADGTYRVFSADGALQRVVRWSPPRTRVEDVWPRFTEAYVQEVSEQLRPAYARLLAMDGLPIPEFVPAFQSLVVDTDGNVWAERYRLPWETEPVWDVFQEDGTWLGSVSTPPNVTVFEIGRDYVLGRHRDEVGVERVVLHSLERSAL